MRRSGRLASKPKVVFDNLDEEEAEPKKKQGREEEDSFGDAKEEVEEEEEGEEEPVSDFSEEPKKKKKNNSKRKSAAPAPKKKAKKKEKEEEKEEEQKEGEEEEEEEEEKKPKVYPKSKYISQEQFAAIDAAAEEYARNQIPVLKEILRKNEQKVGGTKDELVQRVSEISVLGAIPLCSSCGGGKLNFDLASGKYTCPGYYDDTDFVRCFKKFSFPEVHRVPFRP